MGEIVNDPVGSVVDQFVGSVATCCHRQDSASNRSRAIDIQSRVSNDDHCIRMDGSIELLADRGLRQLAKFDTVRMKITEDASVEIMADSIAIQFHMSTSLGVPR